jgi:hypothetical protein
MYPRVIFWRAEMRLIALSVLFSLLATTAHAQAFGVVMGAPASRYGGKVVTASPYYFRISVPDPNDEFESYAVLATPETGICKVSAIGRTHSNDEYGTQVKAKFKDLESALAEKYGRPREFDFLKSGALWDGPREWVWSVYKHERTLASYWLTSTGASLPSPVEAIQLDTRSVDPSSGAYVALSYEFSNFDACKKIIARSDSSGL